MDVHEPVPGKISLVKKVRNLIVHPLPKTATPPVAHITPQTIETIAQDSKPKHSSPLDLPKSTIRISGKTQRATRMAEYRRRKTIQKELDDLRTDSKPMIERNINAIISLPTETITKDTSDNLPSGFKEVKSSDTFLSVNTADMPWLRKDENIPLVEITLKDSGEKTFYYGSCIRESLVDAANMLDEHQSKVTNNLLYSHLPRFVQSDSHPYIKRVDDEVTEKPIYCVYNKGGSRAYFMRFDDINKKPVIIRVAVCDKSGEGQRLVLNVLTRSPQRVIKRAGKL